MSVQQNSVVAQMTCQPSTTTPVVASAISALISALDLHLTSMQTLVRVFVTQLRTFALLHTQHSTLLLASVTAQLTPPMQNRLAELARSGTKLLAHANAQLHNKSAMAELYGTTNSVPASALSQETVLITQESPSTTLTMSVLASVTPPSQDAEHSLSTTLPMSATVSVF